jgi:hypothetical protein
MRLNCVATEVLQGIGVKTTALIVCIQLAKTASQSTMPRRGVAIGNKRQQIEASRITSTNIGQSADRFAFKKWEET